MTRNILEIFLLDMRAEENEFNIEFNPGADAIA